MKALVFSVNGEEMMRLSTRIGSGIVFLSASTSTSPSSSKSASLYSNASGGRDGMLRRRYASDCTLLDGMFDNEVRLLNSKPASSRAST